MKWRFGHPEKYSTMTFFPSGFSRGGLRRVGLLGLVLLGSLVVGGVSGCSYIISENNAQGEQEPSPSVSPETPGPQTPTPDVSVPDAGLSQEDAGALDIDAGINPTPDAGLTTSPISLVLSSLEVSTSETVADGESQVQLTANLVREDGTLATDVDVTWNISGVGTFFSEQEATDAEGVAKAILVSAEDGLSEVELIFSSGALVSSSIVFSECISELEYFASQVQPALNLCIGCHNKYGRAAEMGAFVLRFADEPNALEDNYATLSDLAFPFSTLDGETLPYLLAKPANIAVGGHFGGLVTTADSDEYAALEAFAQRLETPQECPQSENAADAFFAGVAEMELLTTLNEASFMLTGEYPTGAELGDFDGTQEAFSVKLDEKMATEAFSALVREWFNDVLYVKNTGIQNAFNETDYPDVGFFNRCSNAASTKCCGEEFGRIACCDDVIADAAYCSIGKINRSKVFENAPLFHIADIVQSGRPLGEMLSDNVRYVNPFSAKMLGFSPSFDADSANDLEEFMSVSVEPTGNNGLTQPVTQGGLLTSPAFLRQFPTTNTNVNRHRARNVYRSFLDLDIMTFLELRITADEDLGEDPFMDARTCSACHAALDPIAGLFKNYTGIRKVERNWKANMRLPGFWGVYDAIDANSVLPEERNEDPLRWLGEQLQDDERFSLAMAANAFRFVTGLRTLDAPTAPRHEDHAAHLLAFRAQRAEIHRLQQVFIDSNQNFKTLIKAALGGRWYRASGVQNGYLADDRQRRAWEISGLGGYQVRTPENFDRKLRAATGFPYRRNGTVASANSLTGEYSLLLGGIDSDKVLVRNQTPSPLSASVARRTANEVSCVAISQHMARDFAERDLIVSSDKTTVPEDENGNPLDDNVTAIRADLTRMHLLLLGEQVDDDSARLQASFDLFVQSWQLMQGESNTLTGRCRAEHDYYDESVVYAAESAVDPQGPVQIRTDPDKVVRAFMAVASYLLADPIFLLR